MESSLRQVVDCRKGKSGVARSFVLLGQRFFRTQQIKPTHQERKGIVFGYIEKTKHRGDCYPAGTAGSGRDGTAALGRPL